jgi:hemerythrin
MAYFQWDNSLDVGIDAMNEEHKVLIGLMNALYEKNTQGADKNTLITAANALWDYVLQHFNNEERYMASIGFPNLEAHKKLHANLLTELQQFINNFKNGEATHLSKDFSTFLNFWLATHIRGIDFRYGDYVAAGLK